MWERRELSAARRLAWQRLLTFRSQATVGGGTRDSTCHSPGSELTHLQPGEGCLDYPHVLNSPQISEVKSPV